MNDFQAIADRVEIEALRGEFTDAAMMRDRPRLASLFTPDGALRMPNIPVEQIGREEIRAGGERLQSQWDFFVQTTHSGTILLDGDTATGRAYIQELARTLDGRQGLNYAVYHDRYQRTAEGWKFAERVYEVRYLDTSPGGHGAPRGAGLRDQPGRRHGHPGSGLILHRPGNGRTTGASSRRAACERLRRRDPRRRRRSARPHQGPAPRGRQRTHRSQRDPPAVGHRRGHQRRRPVRRHQAAPPGHRPCHRRRRDPKAGRRPRIRRQQRRRGHRDRLARSCLGQRQPTPCQRGRRRPRGLDRRRAEGGARPEHSAAPRRGARPPTGERPRPGGVRDAQRRQPPAHPQRGTPPGARHRAASPRGHRILTRPRVRSAHGLRARR